MKWSHVIAECLLVSLFVSVWRTQCLNSFCLCVYNWENLTNDERLFLVFLCRVIRERTHELLKWNKEIEKVRVRFSGSQTSSSVARRDGGRPGRHFPGTANGRKIVLKIIHMQIQIVSTCLPTKKNTIADTSRLASFKRRQPNYTCM